MFYKKVCDAEVNKFYDISHYNKIILNDAVGYKEDGTPLFIFKKRIIKGDYTHTIIKRGKTKTKNRGSAAGVCDVKNFPKGAVKLIHPTKKHDLEEGHNLVSVKYVDKDGKECSRCQSNIVRSGCAGYFDKVGALPCRKVGWSRDNPDKHEQLIGLAEEINEVYKNNATSHYFKQKEQADKTKDFLFGNTAFSTMTINYDFRTACHRDKGDFVGGLSTLCCFEAVEGNYVGFYLGLPEYKIAIDVRDRDLLIFDAHEFHCNTDFSVLSDRLPIDDITGKHHAGRGTCVTYLRDRLYKCPYVSPNAPPNSPTKPLIPSYPYKIAIPSYNRPELLRIKTLKMLEHFPKQMIYIFLRDEVEKALYDLDKEYNIILDGAVGIMDRRNSIKDYFDDGERIVFIDDDIECINDINRHPMPVKEVIQSCFKVLDDTPLKVWGLYPVNNNIMMKPNVTTDLRYVIGCFSGCIMDKECETRSVSMVEDIERTIKYYKKYGGVVRVNYFAPKTQYYRVKGGITNGDVNLRKINSKKDSEALNALYPEITKIRERKNGYWDIKLMKPKK